MKYYHYLLLLLSLISCRNLDPDTPHLQISISYPSDHYEETLDGRLLLLISTDESSEPRFQLRDGVNSCQGFGMDIEDWQPGESIAFDVTSFGYPIQNMSEVPKGDYTIQVLFHKYETFNRSDGHTVKMPMDRGEGQQWNRAPGNVYSTPSQQRFDPMSRSSLHISLDNIIPPIPKPEDTEYVKHVTIKSELLSEFWGRDMYLGAHVPPTLWMGRSP